MNLLLKNVIDNFFAHRLLRANVEEEETASTLEYEKIDI